MKKNTSGQVIGAQMITASDGTAFTGSVTAYVTGDGGTQAAGSVGSGACTHEGNGFHTYAPAQAETNYDHIGFTFTGTGAVPVTIQVYTQFPQTGDNFARIGAPVGASISADIAAVKTDTSNTYSRIGAPAGASVSADIAAVKTDTSNTYSRIGAPVGASISADVAAVKTDTGNTYSRIGAPAGASVSADIAAVKTDTTNLDATISSRATPAQVKTQVVAALDTDTYGEPAQGAPAATTTLAAKINFLYKAWRNRVTQTATTFSVYADDAVTVDHKATVSDDGTTFSRGELTSGP